MELEERVGRLERLCTRLLFLGETTAPLPDPAAAALRKGLAAEMLAALERQHFRGHFLKGSMSTAIERLLDEHGGENHG